MNSDTPLALQLSNIDKRFGALRANRDISLTLRSGEVLGLLGENGAGKTTLINILFGHYVADTGTIRVFGQPLPPGQPAAAIAAGIGLVHQHFTLAPNLTVLDNVMAGTESLWRWRSARRHARAELRRLSSEFGLQVDPDARVAQLSLGERQRTEILKSLYRQARILVLDEPTAVLTPQESLNLFATLKRLVERGLSVILISHKLDEVLRIADRIAILRAGELVVERAAVGIARAELADLMVGRRIARPARQPLAPGKPVLQFEGASLHAERGRVALAPAHLQVCQHEIVALVGVAGNGQRSVIDLACSLAAPDGGRVLIDGRDSRSVRTDSLHRHGVARIPEDRHEEGVIGDLPIWQNAIIEDLRERRFTRFGWLRRGSALAHCRLLIEAFDIRCSGPQQRIRLLSGGNMQKVIIGRGLSIQPKLIVACQPTRGLDEGAVADVHTRLLAARARGAGVLLVTEDLDEALQLADRIIVIQRGRLSEPLVAPDYDVSRIGMMMLGDAAPHATSHSNADHAH